MKKTAVLVLGIIISFGLISACSLPVPEVPTGSGPATDTTTAETTGIETETGTETGTETATETTSAEAETSASDELSQIIITLSNTSDYLFYELYISPTADDQWGENLLAGNAPLEINDSVEIELEAHDFNVYDLGVLDEEQDEYYFFRVPLDNGSEVSVYFGEDGLAADITDASGNIVTVPGSVNITDPDGDPGNVGDEWIEFYLINELTSNSLTEFYLMPPGSTDDSVRSNNLLEALQQLAPEEVASISVNSQGLFDVLLIDDAFNEWYFSTVELEPGYIATIADEDGVTLMVIDAEENTVEYVSEQQLS